LRRVRNFLERRSGWLSLVFINKPRYYFSNQIGFDEKLDSISTPCHIHGYFQTWKFAEDSVEDFAEILNSYVAISREGSELIAESLSKLPIVIHIRLGDYRNEINKKFGILGADYYISAIELVRTNPQIDANEFWVYSDEINTARKLYSDAFPKDTKWVDELNQIENTDVFVAMRNASAHIIGNSSFSWWAAYSSSTSAMTVAPRKWFMNMEDPKYLLPSNWVKNDSSWRTSSD
jgi:hypothetical protein